MKKISLLLVLILFLAACGNSMNMEPAASADMAFETPPPSANFEETIFFSVADTGDWVAENFVPEPSPGSTTASFEPSILPLQRLIIRNADIQLRTYEFDQTMTDIEQIVSNRGGFVENSRMWSDSAWHDRTIQLWRVEYTLRVPVGLFDQTNRELTELAQVQHFSTTSEDATMEFSDLASRVRIREEELRRVELMLANAIEISDIINLEARVTNIRLAVDAYNRRMTEIDQLAGFSTITMTVHEVVEIEEVAYIPDSFGTRLIAGFSASLNFMTTVGTGLAMFIAWVGLPALLIGGVTFAMYLVLRKTGVWGKLVRGGK